MIRPVVKGIAIVVAAIAILAVAIGGAAWWAVDRYTRSWTPDPETIATASLQSMRAQNRLVPFQARYVAVVTATQRRFGLTAQKTLIMPGTARYELDLGKLDQGDVVWDAAANRLTVTLPPIEVTGPEVDPAQMRAYDGGGVLMRLTDAEQALDTANMAAARRELMMQARAPTPLRLAREAAVRAMEHSFAMPLVAAGLPATVTVRFAGETNDEQMDRSRSIQDIYARGR